jgi:VWFA-related protein
MLLLLYQLILQSPQAHPVFTSSTEMAVLQVSVADKHAGYVGGLPREAFTVYEDGRPQEIKLFANDDTPVTVGLIVDNSGSMLRRVKGVVEAGMAFAESSRPDDEIFTINFNENVWPGLPSGQDFTSDRVELQHALDRAGARGKTALFDAIDEGLRHIDGGRKSRRVLIVISDGGDNASHTGFEDVLDKALRGDVVIYAVGIYDRDVGSDAKPGVLRQLAAATGGEAFFPPTFDEVRPTLERIAKDIRSSYTIGYAPPVDGAAGRTRRIRVDVHPPDKRKLTVRARSAYITGSTEARK